MIENPSNLTQQLLNLVERVAVEIRAIYNKLQTAVFKVNGQIPDSEGNIQIDAVTKATQDGNGNVISNTYVKKTDKVTSASSADSAIKATQDASGNVITSTYATKSELNAIDVGVTSVNGQTGAVTVSTITGNAGTATKLATPRTITLAGDATGSASFDGSSDVTLDVTVSGGSSEDCLKGDKITAAMPISAGDIVVCGTYVRDLEMEDVLEGYMPLKDCHTFYLSRPILVATSNIASGETSDAVSQFGKFSVANILESPLTVGQPVFVRCFAGEQCLTPNGGSLILESLGPAYPELEDVTYEATDLLVQQALSPYPEVEMLFGGLNGYVLLGTASSESEVVLSPSHLVFLDSQFNGTMFTYSEVARYDENGKDISVTYASKSEVSSTYATKEELKNVGGRYTLPAATSTTLGGVKIGSNITNSSGTISLTKANVTNALGYTPLQTAPVTSVNGQTGAVTVEAGIPKTGDRGALAGFETSLASTDSEILINAQMIDCLALDSATTIEVENGDYETSWTKSVFIFNTKNASVVLGDNWRWSNDEVPTIGAMGYLLLHWNYIYGVATYIEIAYD